MNIKKILTPIEIGKVKIKNRVAMAPMALRGLLDSNGTPGPRALDFYLERARGGVGLIITTLFKVENEIDSLMPGLPMVSADLVPPLTEIAEAIHAFDSKVFVQLTAGFGRVARPAILRKQPVSASAVPNYWQPEIICREITTEEVEKLIKCFGIAAQILASAGIDGIELHGHEGYLFDQFTTAIWNKREDRYGGNLLERLRLPIEVLNEIKSALGKDFPVQYRFGLKHFIKGLHAAALPGEKFIEAGRDIPEGLEMARELERAGFDALHVNAGCYDSWYWAAPPIYQEHGCLARMSAEVKKVVKIPVITVGRLEVPTVAEKIIEEGQADLIALGRGLLTDPFWVQKFETGLENKIRPCIGCYDGCLGRVAQRKPLSCAVNPATGRERSYALTISPKPKQVLIIGGGVAGMEAARTTAIRGHQVTLYEKKEILGGCLIPGSVPSFKKDLCHLLKWYESELEDLQVKIHLGIEGTPHLIEEMKPDIVLIATGGRPIVPRVPGMEENIVATAPEILTGKIQPGERVVIVGGGLVGCETAVWLAQQGKKVTIIEIFNDLMIGKIPTPHMIRLMMFDLLRYYHVEWIVGSWLTAITSQGILFKNKTTKEGTLESDTVVVAIGQEPEQTLFKDLVGRRSKLYLIGDAREPRNIMGAVWDAYEVGRAI